MISDNAGFFYVVAVRTKTWPGNTGDDKNVFKIDSSTGVVVASYDTGHVGFSGSQLYFDSNGDLLLAQASSSGGASVPGDDGGAAANVFKFDSSLNLLARANVNWSSKLTNGDMSRVKIATDSVGKVYLVTGGGFLVRLSSDLATEEISLALPSIPVPPVDANRFSTTVADIDHNQAGELVVFAGADSFNRPGFSRARIIRYDNDGGLLRFFEPRLTAFRFTHGHVLPATPALTAATDIGEAFTTELSQNPPGRVQAIVAVKYDAGNIVSIFWNSVALEFKPLEWTAVHSEHGSVLIKPSAPGWEYNSPL